VSQGSIEERLAIRELIFTKEVEQKTLIGCFHDEYVKEAGERRFQSRDYEVVGLH